MKGLSSQTFRRSLLDCNAFAQSMDYSETASPRCTSYWSMSYALGSSGIVQEMATTCPSTAMSGAIKELISHH